MASSTISVVTRSDAFRAAADCEPRSRLSSFATVREFWIQEGAIPLDAGGNTILHFLAMYGNAFVIQKLIDDDNGNNNSSSSSTVKCGDLFGRNDKGNTPLHEAVRFGRKNVVEILLQKQESLVRERNCLGETPVYVAVACGHEDVFDHVIKKVNRNQEMTRSTDNSNLLHAAVMGEHYGLAMSILEAFPQLAQNPDAQGRTAFYLLAQKSKSFKSGSFYSPHNFLSGSLILSMHLFAVLVYWFIPSMAYQSKHNADVENQQQLSKLKGFRASIVAGFITVFKACRHTREIYDEKQKHAFAFELGKRLVQEEREWSRYLDDHMGSPIVEATKKGIIELVSEILGKFPDAAYDLDKNSDNARGKNILHIAVEHKDWNIYNLLKRKIKLRDGMLVGDVDNNGNTILHLAAKLGTPSFRSVQRGHLYQMIWDVCWFEHVSHDSPPHLMYIRNSDGEMATDAFLREHSEIRSEAEKAVKDVNNCLMLVVAVCGSGNYAALLTPPGGYRQDEKDAKYGLPVIFTEEMRIYILLILSGLFTGALSFVVMLSIQSLPFRSSDFYLNLPLRLFLATSSLVLSMTFTGLSCRQAYRLDHLYLPQGLALACYYGVVLLLTLAYIDVTFLTVYYLTFVKSINTSF